MLSSTSYLVDRVIKYASVRANVISNCAPALMVALLLGGCSAELPQDVADASDVLPSAVDFNFDVKPILSDKCFSCHGPDAEARKAGLRLDEYDAAIAELPETPGKWAIVPGNPSQSELVSRILSTDPDYLMPAKSSQKTLSAAEKAILVRWIEQGAEYAQHWAFIPPEKPTPPDIMQSPGKGPDGNEIDDFVLARLKGTTLQPAPSADAETLITRATFTLTGLPPTPEEIDAFRADDNPGAWERLLDRLLASPRYGERMASYWMDVARYADTDGYQLDIARRLFPWRDWVIDAFNSNQPYDEFVTWQLAGDLLPDASREQRLATAFNRLHRRNSEEGIDSEEFRVEYVLDRTNTVGKAFLGLTLECARCHDHKYDPISQKAYYRMSAFFNSTNENGMYIDTARIASGAAMSLPTSEQSAALAEARKAVDEKTAALRANRNDAAAAANSWISSISNTPGKLREVLAQSVRDAMIAHYPFDEVNGSVEDWMLLEPAQLTPDLLNHDKPAKLREPMWKPGVNGQALFIGDYTSVFLPEGIGQFDHTDPFTIDLWVYPDRLYETATVVQGSNPERRGHRGYNLFLENNRLRFMMAHAWPRDYLEVISDESLPVGKWSRVTVAYSGDKAEGVHLYINGTETHLTTRYNRLTRTAKMRLDPIPFFGPPGVNLGARLHIPHLKGGGIDDLRFFKRQLTDLEVAYLHDNNVDLDLVQNTNNSDMRRLREYAIDRQPAVIEGKARLQQARMQLVELFKDVPQMMIMGDTPEPRQTYVLERGVFSEHGEAVEPRGIDTILPYDPELPQNRTGLARWLFDENNPLTARVFVNRLWQMHFGNGLVNTADDFGAQGSVPSHPKLLDWLAVTFMESGWDIKAMHKLILMSSTYRQSSTITPETYEADPQNAMLARGPRFRLPAEMIRDNALAVSGLLVEQLGGESQFPYQPGGYSESSPGIPARYPPPEEVGDGLYRRSLYTHWKRQAPPPFMVIFDKTQADVCAVDRPDTNSPLQALALLNGTQFVEASRVLAQRVSLATPDIESRLSEVFYRLIRRSPDAEELTRLQTYYNTELQRFEATPGDARKYLNVGQTPIDDSLDVPGTAALAVIASVILNTPDAYTLR